MKRGIEGALHEPVYTSKSGEDFDELVLHTLPAFADLADFLSKAERLSRLHPAPKGTLRAEYVASLRIATARIRRWLDRGIPVAPLDDAVSAALAFANICAELRDDQKHNADEPLTRRKYAALQSRNPLGKDIAAESGMSASQLSKWKAKNSMPRAKRVKVKRRA